MRTYLIVENDIRNAFLSNSRNTVKHLQDSGNNTCAAYDANGYLVSYAERHYQTMSGVICQALDLLYAQEEAKDRPS